MESLAERLAAYQAPAPSVAEPDKSVIQLKKKTADGSFVPVSAP